MSNPETAAIDLALANLCNYLVHTTDVEGVVWVYPKIGGSGTCSFRYEPLKDLRLLMECAKQIPKAETVQFSFGDGSIVAIILVDVATFYNGRGPTEEDALYDALTAYVESI